MKELAIYIHIPFCSSKCYYCDFVSYPRLEKRIGEYIDYLLVEMDLYKEKLQDYIVKTVFIGGGTPSHIDGENIARLLEFIYTNYNSDNIKEVTLEANPETITYEKAKLYSKYGINRISMGVQTLNNKLLRKIGRNHTSYDVYRSYEILRKVGINDINIDLMFGLPNQTMKDCIGTLESIADLGAEHISYYSLIIEEKTLMYRWHKEGKVILPNEELEREMYHSGIDFLKSKGYKHYEISNFSKEGFECKHNLFYWKLKPYIGVGISAHSNIENKRFWNHDKFNRYFDELKEENLPISGEEYIDNKMEIAEYVIMGLRLIDGVNKSEFRKRFNINLEDIYGNVLSKYEKQGLILEDNSSYKFTRKGLDLSNIVYVDLLPD